MKKSLLLSILSFGIIAFVLMSSEQSAHTNSGNPPVFNSGAPGQSSCSNANCHDSAETNSGDGSVSIGFGDGVAEYEAGKTYEMTVTIEEAGKGRFGFQLCALDADGENAGSLEASGENTAVQSTAGIDFVNHNGAVVVDDSHTYSFSWTAPSSDIGAVTFYTSGMAANGAGSPQGDNSYTTSSSVTFTFPADITTIGGESWGFYPNPASDILTVVLPNTGNANLFSIDGKMVQTWNLQQGENTLDLMDVNTGVYILSIEGSNGKNYMERLIVE